MRDKTTYRTILALNLAHRGIDPGDILSLSLSNETSDDGIYKQASRLNLLFCKSFGFFPASIALHPDHLALLKKQGKRLDITISDMAARLLESMVDLASIPRTVPFIEDASLDLFTAVARYHFQEEEADDLAQEVMMAALTKLME